MKCASKGIKKQYAIGAGHPNFLVISENVTGDTKG
jgi:hypothetical protein